MKSHPGVAAAHVRDAARPRRRAQVRLDLADQDRLLRPAATRSSARSRRCTRSSISPSLRRSGRMSLTPRRRRRRDRRGGHRHARAARRARASRTCGRSRGARSAGRVAYGEGELSSRRRRPTRSPPPSCDLCFFSVGTDASRELVPHAAEAGPSCIDKSDAFRLTDGIPLVVAGVNDDAIGGEPIVANPNCSAIQLTCVLKPLHDAAGPRPRPPRHLPVDVRRGRRRHRAPARRAADGGRPRDGLGARRRGVQRGVEAPRRDAEDPRAARSAAPGDLRAGPRARRPRAGGLGRDRGAALARARRREILAAAPHVELAELPDPGRRRRTRRGARRPDPARHDDASAGSRSGS